MGAEQSQHQLDLIEQQATSVILSYRAAEGALEKEACLRKLKDLSNEAVKLKHAKRKRVDATIACIDDYVREISGSRRASTFVESTSFVAMPTPKKAVQQAQPISLQEQTSLQDIRGRVLTLKQEIKTAVNNNDSKTLRTLERTIRILTEDLQKLPTGEEAVEELQRQLTSCFNKVSKAKQDLRKLELQEHERNVSIRGSRKKEFDALEAAVEEQNIMLQTALRSDNQLLVKHVFDKVEEFKAKLRPLTEGARKERLQAKIDDMSCKTNERLERYTVANRLAEHERDFQTIKTKTDASDKQKHLETLKKHIEDIPDSYQELQARKRALLHDLQQELLGMQQDQVVLRKPPPQDTLKIMADLMECWGKTKAQLPGNCRTTEDAKHAYLMLNKLESAVRETKQELQEKFDFRKVSFQNDTASIRSYTNQDLVKTKAKIYNIPITEIKQLNNATVKAQTEKKIEALNDLRNIQSKVNFLKDKLQGDPKNEGCRAKLQNYHDKLADYTGWSNDNVSNKARALRDEIHEILVSLTRRKTKNSRPSSGRISIEASLERIVQIQTSVNTIEEEILRDLDNAEALQEHRDKLHFNKNKLDGLQINPQYDMIRQSRDSAMEKINYCLNIVDNKLKYFTRDTKQMGKEQVNVENSGKVELPKDLDKKSLELDNQLKEELKKLKEQVDRFSGGYKNVLYNDIETKLNKLLLETVDDQLIPEIERTLKILEQRSTKTQSFRASIRPSSTLNRKEQDSEIEQKLSSINESLSGIKRDIRIEDPVSLSGRLNLLKIEADQLYLRASENLKSLINELLDDIDGCCNFVTNRLNTELTELTDLDHFELPMATVQKKTSSEIQQRLTKLKDDIRNFIGLENSEGYEKLDNEILTLTLEADKLAKSNNKLKIHRDLEECDKKLQERAKQCEELSKIERDIEQIKQRKPNLSNNLEVEDLDEELTALQVRIGRLNLDKNLENRSKKSHDFVKGYLQEIRGLNGFDADGTLV